MTKWARCGALLIAVVSAVLNSGSVLADDAAAQQKYDEAVAAFAKRGDLTQNDLAIDLLDQAMQQEPSSELAYRILILKSHAYYWRGNQQTTDANRMAVYQQSMDAAEEARKLNDEYADADYWYSVALGKWALAKGVLASLSRKGELIAAAESATERMTQDGEDGAMIDYWGPARVLGRMYFKLPSFAGGSRDKALQYLSEAYEKAPNHVLNVSYYAEVLGSGSAAEKAKARTILDKLIADFERDPAALNPDRIPETAQEMIEARQVRKELGN